MNLTNYAPLFMMGIANTLLVTISALCIGLSGGLFFGVLSCNQYWSWWSAPIRLYVLIIRGTPVCLQLLLIYFALPAATCINLSPLAAGIVTLGINSIAYVTEIIRSGINSVQQGQWDACHVLGLSKLKTLKSIILPQVASLILSPLTNETITLIKETSITSIIGLLELTRIGMNISAKTLDPITTYGTIAITYLIITTVISYCSHIFERKLLL